MRGIYRKIHHALYLYIKRNVEKVWGARYTLGARYLSKNTVQRCFRFLIKLKSRERHNTFTNNCTVYTYLKATINI